MGSEPLEAFPGCNFFLAAFDACSRYVAAPLAHRFTTQPYQQVGNGYFHRTHFTTNTTQARRSRQIPGFLQPHHVRHQDATDRAGISRAISVTAYPGIDRAMVHASTTANAAQGIE